MTPKILLQHKSHVECLLDLLALISDEDDREKFIKRNEAKIFIIDKSEAKKNRIQWGYFSKNDLTYMMHVYLKEIGKPEGVKTTILDLTIKQLLPYFAIIESPIVLNEYQINSKAYKFYRENNTLDSIVFGLLYTLEKYKRSIPAINVITVENDEHCGSGLLVKINTNVLGILTNAHVIENNTIKSIKAGDLGYTLSGDPIIYEDADLAFLPIKMPSVHTPPFVLSNAEILKTIIVIGYPRISTAVDQYALFHKGEVNGEIKTTEGKTFIAISCHVSPGNSGGPIISEIGELVGMVTQSNTGEYKSTSSPNSTSTSTYNMAIPSYVIGQFLDIVSDHFNI